MSPFHTERFLLVDLFTTAPNHIAFTRCLGDFESHNGLNTPDVGEFVSTNGLMFRVYFHPVDQPLPPTLQILTASLIRRLQHTNKNKNKKTVPEHRPLQQRERRHHGAVLRRRVLSQFQPDHPLVHRDGLCHVPA